jgi:membrane-bound lytic murein transglycosylase D
MQWKLLWCTLFIVQPVLTPAQNTPSNQNSSNTIKPTDEKVSNKSVTNTANLASTPTLSTKTVGDAKPSVIAAKATGFEANESSNTNLKTTAVTTDKNKEKAPLLAANVPTNTVAVQLKKPLDRKLDTNDQYKRIPFAGEVDYFGAKNGVMLDYVKNYAQNFSGRFNNVKSKGQVTMATMEKILKSHALPTELKYLAVIESALNKNAKSPVGALGYWQFMAGTAQMMGLTVSGKRDDRTDLNKSTHAAAKYLKYLYDQLDDWLLVIAAYNSGPRPVVNAMRKTGKDDFWSIKQYLPKETQNHVMAFVATATIMERLHHLIPAGIPKDYEWTMLNVTPKKAGLAEPAKPKNPLLSKFSQEEINSMTIVRIKKPLDLEVVANAIDMERRQLGRWNYDYFDYLAEYKTDNVYNFRIPKDKLDKFLEKLGEMEIASRNMAKLK